MIFKRLAVFIKRLFSKKENEFDILHKKLKDLFCDEDINGINDIFEQIRNTPNKKIKSWKIREVKGSDC